MRQRRLSPVVLKHGSRRPEVWMLQEALNALGYDCGKPDGWWGVKTTKAVTLFQTEAFGAEGVDQLVGTGTWSRLLERTEAETEWRPELWRRIQTVICYYENSGATNAYGGTSKLKDGAGWNYGVLQHNGYGSLDVLLRMAGQTDLLRAYRAGGRDKFNADIRDWMGSVEGIAAQDRYFQEKTAKQAREIADELRGVTDFFEQAHLLPYYERYLLILVGAVVQNGALLSPNRKPFWRSITEAERRYANNRELFDGHRFNLLMKGEFTYHALKATWTQVEESVRNEIGVTDGSPSSLQKQARRKTNLVAMQRILRDHIEDPGLKLVLIAQWRARSSSPQWWTDVEDRQMLAATGAGRVHGSGQIDLVRDFGFTDAASVGWRWSKDGANALDTEEQSYK